MDILIVILLILIWPAIGIFIFSLMCILHGWPDEYERRYCVLYVLIWPVTLAWGLYYYIKYGGK